jgi:hypothetical protein
MLQMYSLPRSADLPPGEGVVERPEIVSTEDRSCVRISNDIRIDKLGSELVDSGIELFKRHSQYGRVVFLTWGRIM